MNLPNYLDIESAQLRLRSHVKETPILSSHLLNDWLGHDIFFKMECLQTTGAFKLRGAYNFIAKLAENNALPTSIVANSSGNHAQAVAYAAKKFNIPVTIYCTKTISPVKAAATKFYGAKILTFDSRLQADKAVAEASRAIGCVWIPPFNHPDIIAGQGTAANEAFSKIDGLDAVFAPCGGGGLISGTYITAKHFNTNIQVVGAEPLNANDAASSLRSGVIETLTHAPNTLADGAATPSVGEYTFEFIKQLDGFYEVNENRIAYWTQWLQHLLKMHIEPTCAMTMQAVADWLNNQPSKDKKRLLVIISGGNISADSMQKVWKTDYLDQIPSL